jgi:hypothetical protein
VKKPFTFKDLSDERCTACNKRIKKNVVARKRGPFLCYKDYVAGQRAVRMRRGA